METSELSAATPRLTYLAPVVIMGVLSIGLVEFALGHTRVGLTESSSKSLFRIGAYLALLVITIVSAVVILRTRRLDRQTVTMTLQAVHITWGDAQIRVPRPGISSIIITSDIVLRDARGVELARCKNSIDPDDLVRTFVAHGYPHPIRTDPDDASFWKFRSPDPRLPRDVSQLLTVREELLRLSDAAQAEALRRRIVRAGFNVRDRGPCGLRYRQEIHPNGIDVVSNAIPV